MAAFETHRKFTNRLGSALLRIGPLFAIDNILNGSFHDLFFTHFNELFIPSWILYVQAAAVVLLLSSTMLILTSDQLTHIYLYTGSCAFIMAAILLNFYTNTIHSYLDSNSVFGNLLVSVLITMMQYVSLKLCLALRSRISAALLATVIDWLIDERFLFGSILVPPLLGGTGTVTFVLMSSAVAVIVLTESYVVLRLFSVKKHFLHARHLLNEFGIQSFVTYHWQRIDVALVMRLFWVIRLTHSLWTCANLSAQDLEPYASSSEEPLVQWPVEVKYLLIHGCDTVVALLGMACLISVIMDNIGIVIAMVIGTNNEDDRYMGMVSGMLFFILGLQTGLTGLLPSVRIVRLYRNFYLLTASTLHYVHSMVDSVLKTLSVSHNASLTRHLRPLLACVALVAFPIWLLFDVWHRHAVSTWLLAITAFSIELIVKVLTSLTIYALFMLDARRGSFWEKLDDYVYYVKSFGNSVEFLFAIFVFCNGSWIMVFESGGTVRAVMMVIHAYFNIWMQARDGWVSFIKRRSAVAAMDSMPRATPEQLAAHNDICSICYSELSAAVVAKCNHLFHSVCLRKWLYLQDVCPICRLPVYDKDTVNNNT